MHDTQETLDLPVVAYLHLGRYEIRTLSSESDDMITHGVGSPCRLVTMTRCIMGVTSGLGHIIIVSGSELVIIQLQGRRRGGNIRLAFAVVHWSFKRVTLHNYNCLEPPDWRFYGYNLVDGGRFFLICQQNPCKDTYLEPIWYKKSVEFITRFRPNNQRRAVGNGISVQPEWSAWGQTMSGSGLGSDS